MPKGGCRERVRCGKKINGGKSARRSSPYAWERCGVVKSLPEKKGKGKTAIKNFQGSSAGFAKLVDALEQHRVLCPFGVKSRWERHGSWQLLAKVHWERLTASFLPSPICGSKGSQPMARRDYRWAVREPRKKVWQGITALGARARQESSKLQYQRFLK